MDMQRTDKGSAPSELRGLSALDGRDGPALAITDAELRAHVASLLEAAQLAASPPQLSNLAQRHSMTRQLGSPAPLGAPQRRDARWRRAPVIALAVVATTTAAAAAAYRGEWVVDWLRDAARAEPAASPPRPRTSTAPAGSPPIEAPPVGVPREVANPRPASIVASPSAPEASAAAETPRPPRAGRPRLARPTRPAPAARQAARDRDPASASDLVAPPAGAARDAREPLRSDAKAVDALERANAARGARRYSEALDTYSSVVERYPSSLQAQAARVAAAALWLERFHDLPAAERLYASALARGGEVAVEARHGLAEVYRARGDSARERAALVEMVQAHPHHPLTEKARARLREMAR